MTFNDRYDEELIGDIDAQRCLWHRGHDDLIAYHDHEWGRPTTDRNRLFEKICLEGFQSGLSWMTILRKREHFRAAFAGFVVERVAAFGDADVERLLRDDRIIRHQVKIEATINNAQRAISLIEAEGDLVDWVWSWAVLKPERTAEGGIPTSTDRSVAFAAELKRRGWRFIGPTTAYAFMQSEGLTNDHLDDCFVRDTCERARVKVLANRSLR